MWMRKQNVVVCDEKNQKKFDEFYYYFSEFFIFTLYLVERKNENKPLAVVCLCVIRRQLYAHKQERIRVELKKKKKRIKDNKLWRRRRMQQRRQQ